MGRPVLPVLGRLARVPYDLRRRRRLELDTFRVPDVGVRDGVTWPVVLVLDKAEQDKHSVPDKAEPGKRSVPDTAEQDKRSVRDTAEQERARVLQKWGVRADFPR